MEQSETNLIRTLLVDRDYKRDITNIKLTVAIGLLNNITFQNWSRFESLGRNAIKYRFKLELLKKR